MARNRACTFLFLRTPAETATAMGVAFYVAVSFVTRSYDEAPQTPDARNSRRSCRSRSDDYSDASREHDEQTDFTRFADSQHRSDGERQTRQTRRWGRGSPRPRMPLFRETQMKEYAIIAGGIAAIATTAIVGALILLQNALS